MEAVVKVSNLVTLDGCDEISFEANPGEIVCLFGMNGCGKTLLIKALCKIFEPVSGKAEVFIERKNTGICLQFPEHLVFCDTALKEATLVTGDEGSAKKLLDEIGVRYDQSPFVMSDGQKRLLFVLGLIDTKHLLLFDEPFASLDDDAKNQVSFSMKNGAGEGKTFIYTANRKADTAIANKIINITGKKDFIPLKI